MTKSSDVDFIHPMSLLPWGNAEEAVERIEKSPDIGGVGAARAAIESLAGRQFIPGVKQRLEEYQARFRETRVKFFETLFQAGDLETARALNEKFAPESEARSAEEILKIAVLARKLGKEAPSIAKINFNLLKPELRPAYFDARYHEAVESNDKDFASKIISAWMSHDPAAVKPRIELLGQHLSAGHYEDAADLARQLPEQHQSKLPDLLANDSSISPHNRAYFLLHTGLTNEAIPVLDLIIKENSKDEWALTERARLADTAGNLSQARFFYARLLDAAPNRIDILKRLGELAYAENDLAEATTRFGGAWEAGDLDSGITYCHLLLAERPADAAGVARKMLDQTQQPGYLTVLGDLLLKATCIEDAARAYRSAVLADFTLIDDIIGKSHAYVESNPGTDRLPLLHLLEYIVPMRGFPPDIYTLMAAEDWMRLGKKEEAKKCVESLLGSDAKWKAIVELAKIVLTEGKVEQEILAKRMESDLPDAERAGHHIWLEICYYAAVLWEAAGNKVNAKTRLEKLVEREYQYRDAIERLRKLKEG